MGWLATKSTLVESLLDSRTAHWLGNLGQDSSSLTQTLELQKNSGGAPEGTRKVSPSWMQRFGVFLFLFGIMILE